MRIAVALAAAVLVAGCAVGPDYEEPEAQVPADWRDALDPSFERGPAELAAWWTRFGDPALDALVDRAIGQGLDLREALARVREARALRGVAGADRFPTIDASASYRTRQDSETTEFASFGVIRTSELYASGFDASWEVDVFGRVSRSIEAADADLAAAIEDTRNVLVSLVAEVALNYVELRALDRRIEVARTNEKLQDETLALVRARFEAGLTRERDLAQASANREATRARVPALETQRRAAENRLAVLLGLAPGALAPELEAPMPIPVPPPKVALGVPADLVRRRADIRQAERVLAGETARIGVAEAELYPRLSLFGNLGVETGDLGELADGGSVVFGFGPSIRWNLFDGGRIRGRVAAQDARREQAMVRWERTVLLALEEAENAMTSFVREQARRDSLVKGTAHIRDAVGLAQTEYREGLVDFQVVVDSERALADAEDEVARSEATISTSLVRLYKALGGGWEHAGPFPAEPAP